MISRDDARRTADLWINDGKSPEDQREVGFHEFEHGYVVWRVEPEPDDPDEPPLNVGGGLGIIDKETGELSYWPPLPLDVVIQQYSARRA